jgi:ribonuclease HI
MHVEVYSDGSATTNDKPGGFAYVLVVDGVKLAEGSGHLNKATNNVAEITAAIRGLEHVQNDTSLAGADTITLVSDSQLVLRYSTGEYQCRKPHLVPLYCKLRQLHNKLKIKTRWVKGHSGDEHNERCDVLAKKAREQQDDEQINRVDKEPNQVLKKTTNKISWDQE